MKQFVIYAKDGIDEQAIDRRMAVRPTHFEGIKKLKEGGNYILGGAILDDNGKMIGSTMILQFETEEEFKNWYNNEPYITGNIWEKIEVSPYRVAVV